MAGRYRQAMFNESPAENHGSSCADRRIVTVVALEGRSETSLLSLAAGIAAGLEPALADAIRNTARERGIAASSSQDLIETTATGVAGSVGGYSVVVGNAALLTTLGISLEHLCDWPERMRQHGQQVVFVAVDGRAAGFLGITNNL